MLASLRTRLRANWKIAVAASGVIVVAVVLLFVLGSGLSESERKAFVREYDSLGIEAQSEARSKYPGDEAAQMKFFRKRTEESLEELIEKYGITREEADDIFREAYEKKWQGFAGE